MSPETISSPDALLAKKVEPPEPQLELFKPFEQVDVDPKMITPGSDEYWVEDAETRQKLLKKYKKAFVKEKLRLRQEILGKEEAKNLVSEDEDFLLSDEILNEKLMPHLSPDKQNQLMAWEMVINILDDNLEAIDIDNIVCDFDVYRKVEDLLGPGSIEQFISKAEEGVGNYHYANLSSASQDTRTSKEHFKYQQANLYSQLANLIMLDHHSQRPSEDSAKLENSKLEKDVQACLVDIKNIEDQLKGLSVEVEGVQRELIRPDPASQIEEISRTWRDVLFLDDQLNEKPIDSNQIRPEKINNFKALLATDWWQDRLPDKPNSTRRKLLKHCLGQLREELTRQATKLWPDNAENNTQQIWSSFEASGYHKLELNYHLDDSQLESYGSPNKNLVDVKSLNYLAQVLINRVNKLEDQLFGSFDQAGDPQIFIKAEEYGGKGVIESLYDRFEQTSCSTFYIEVLSWVAQNLNSRQKDDPLRLDKKRVDEIIQKCGLRMIKYFKSSTPYPKLLDEPYKFEKILILLKDHDFSSELEECKSKFGDFLKGKELKEARAKIKLTIKEKQKELKSAKSGSPEYDSLTYMIEVNQGKKNSFDRIEKFLKNL